MLQLLHREVFGAPLPVELRCNFVPCVFFRKHGQRARKCIRMLTVSHRIHESGQRDIVHQVRTGHRPEWRAIGLRAVPIRSLLARLERMVECVSWMPGRMVHQRGDRGDWLSGVSSGLFQCARHINVPQLHPRNLRTVRRRSVPFMPRRVCYGS